MYIEKKPDKQIANNSPGTNLFFQSSSFFLYFNGPIIDKGITKINKSIIPAKIYPKNPKFRKKFEPVYSNNYKDSMIFSFLNFSCFSKSKLNSHPLIVVMNTIK